MFGQLRLIRSQFRAMGPRDKAGIVIGVIGLVICILGLLVAIQNNAAKSDPQEMLLGHPRGTAIEMLLYVAGAVFLVISALLSGSNARLLQIQETALIISGVMFFTIKDPASLFTARLLMLLAMFIVAKLLLRVVKGPLGWVGFAGVEALNWGYLYNSALGFAVGGLLLVAYNWVKYRRTGNWVNYLFRALNAPFALFALVLWTMRTAELIGWISTVEILASFMLLSFGAIYAYLGVKYPRMRLDGKTLLEEVRTRAPLTSVFTGPEGEAPFFLVRDGHVVSDRPPALLQAAFVEMMALKRKVTTGTASAREREQLVRLSGFIADVTGMLHDLLERHGVDTTGLPASLLLEAPTPAFEQQPVGPDWQPRAS